VLAVTLHPYRDNLLTIGGEIRIIVKTVRNSKVLLLIEAPPEMSIDRGTEEIPLTPRRPRR